MRAFVSSAWVFAVALLLSGCGSMERTPVGEGGSSESDATTPVVVTLSSPSPLVVFKLMVRSGSADDPERREGLARLTAELLVEGGFGDESAPIKKEDLAEIVLPWGDGAMPGVFVGPETTTFHFTVPKEVLPDYVDRVLRPMFSQPLFLESEVDRLKTDLLSELRAFRLEDLESLGLGAIDAAVHARTGHAHRSFGYEDSIPRLDRESVRAFHADHYRAGNVILGVSTDEPAVVSLLEGVVASLEPGAAPAPPSAPRAARSGLEIPDTAEPGATPRRTATVVGVPGASAGVHMGFPIEVSRGHEDFWPLWVATVWLGVHRDSFGRLYRAIRQERGYNYGDYAYIEHWEGRPRSLFQIFCQPRERQYFSIWIRPIAPEYAVHLAKAVSYELERLVREGLTPDEVEAAKRKAKVLYLSLAETVERLVGAKMDDAFHHLEDGFLESYLDSVGAVTVDRINEAIRRHLSSPERTWVFLTSPETVEVLVASLEADRAAWGKGPAEYEFARVEKDGVAILEVPEVKVDTLRLDGAWAHTPLRLDAVRKVSVDAVFRGDGAPAPASP